jgi:hypothetical protein
VLIYNKCSLSDRTAEIVAVVISGNSSAAKILNCYWFCFVCEGVHVLLHFNFKWNTVFALHVLGQCHPRGQHRLESQAFQCTFKALTEVICFLCNVLYHSKF